MKKLIRANSLYLAISLLSSSSTILLIPLYLSNFSVVEYGELALMNATFPLLAIILTLSIESAFQTFYFDYSPEEVPAYFKSVYSFALLLVIVMVGIIALAGPFVFSQLFSSEDISFYPNGILITASVAFTLLNQIYFVLLRNQEKVKRFGRFVAINTIVNILFQVFFIVVLKKGVTGAIMGALLGNFLVFVLTLRYTNAWRFQISSALINKSLKYCIWLIPFFLINWFIAKGDRMVVENFIGLEALAVYALLLNISMVISLLATAILNSVRPTLFKEFKKLSGKLNKSVLNIVLYFSGIISLASLALYFFVQNLDYFSIFEKYLKIQEYIVLALILFGVRGFVRLFSEYLSFRKKSRDMFAISLVNLLCFVPLLVYFAADLDLKMLLSMLILSNSAALFTTIGRCYYLLKTRSNA